MTQAIFAAALLTAEAEEPDTLELVLPNLYEMVAAFIAFGIVFFFVQKFALPKLNELLEARQKAISGQLQEAESIKTEAQSLLDDYRQQVAGAKTEANQIVEEARGQADVVKADLIAKAQSEAEGIVGKAREDASTEKARALSEARQEVANMSIGLAERVVGSNLDRAAQQGLVDSYLADLEGA